MTRLQQTNHQSTLLENFMAVSLGDQYRSLMPISVALWWTYNEMALVDDEWHSFSVILPVDTQLTVFEWDKDDSSKVLTTARRWRKLRGLLPKGTQHWSPCRWFPIFASPTQFLIEVSISDLESKCAHVYESRNSGKKDS